MHKKPTVKAFYLADPLLWVANSDNLKWTILKATKVSIAPMLPAAFVSTIDFAVDALCGHIRCDLNNALWSDKEKPEMFNLAEEAAQLTKVKREAKAFLKHLNDECNTVAYRRLNIPPIIPAVEYIRLLDVYLVPHHTNPYIDHWLCRFLVYLPSSVKGRTRLNASGATENDNYQDEIPVMGGDIELRIGSNYKVIGFDSSWRPTDMTSVEAEMLEIDMNAVQTSHHHEDHEEHKEHGEHDEHDGHEDAENKLPLIYMADGAQSPQNMLTPYYLKQDGHASFFFPASDRSLEIDFYQEYMDGKKVKVHASVSGGSGDYCFHWSRYNITGESWDDNSFILEGSGQVSGYDKDKKTAAISALIVDEGVHNLILLVGDNQTNVIKQKQVTVYTNTVHLVEEPA